MTRRFAVLLVVAAIAACGAGEEAEPPVEQTATPPARPAPAPAPPPPDTAPVARPAQPASQPAAAERPAERLYTVQIAAYLQPDSAQRLQGLLTQRGLPVWTTAAEVNGRTYHRVRIGALQDLAAVRSLGRRIAQQYESEVWIAPVDARDAIPAGAIDATRALVTGA